jgi:hypothetical protein
MHQGGMEHERGAANRQGGRGALSAARGWSTGVRVEYLSWVCKTVNLLRYLVVEYRCVKTHRSPCLCKPIYTHGYQPFWPAIQNKTIQPNPFTIKIHHNPPKQTHFLKPPKIPVYTHPICRPRWCCRFVGTYMTLAEWPYMAAQNVATPRPSLEFVLVAMPTCPIVSSPTPRLVQPPSLCHPQCPHLSSHPLYLSITRKPKSLMT